MLEFLVPSEILEDDLSCENMGYASRILEEEFDSSTACAKYECDFNMWHTPFIVAGMLGNSFFNQGYLPEELYLISKSISESGVFLEETLEFDYVKTEL